MDGTRFDTLLRQAATRPGSRRALVAGLLAGLAGGTAVAPLAHEAAAGGKCDNGKKKCQGGCCPRNASVCCRKGCCKDGTKCCQNGSKCCRN